jgi:hypothetical protein
MGLSTVENATLLDHDWLDDGKSTGMTQAVTFEVREYTQKAIRVDD